MVKNSRNKVVPQSTVNPLNSEERMADPRRVHFAEGIYSQCIKWKVRLLVGKNYGLHIIATLYFFTNDEIQEEIEVQVVVGRYILSSRFMNQMVRN